METDAGRGLSPRDSALGDIPFFVAHDSADVWAAPDRFLLDASGEPTVVSGVPPDYFSEDGQRWGTPLYDWKAHKGEAFAWWRRRMQRMYDLFDVVRIDHFRAVDSAWAIPADHLTARDGAWTPGPGDALLEAIRAPEGKHLVAEDLGIIPKACSSCVTVTGCQAWPCCILLTSSRRTPTAQSTTPRTPWCTPARTTTTPRSAGDSVR